ncbi:DeoR/GlpR family DNA-binding transcription regulator [Neobacillus niacini]|uniref:DeoR/GlpR family DNA-binding transcription regulator n=1 Tax=Neobacillus niacini TaxID=86668 RepID=UPI003002221F
MSSLTEKRQQKIMEYLEKHRIVKTAELSNWLNVSEVTIRRDVKELEQNNQIERFHGGIRLIEDLSDKEMLFEEKGSRFNEEKKQIAKEAVNFVQDGDTIFINSGSTALSVIKAINDSGKIVRIVTNNALAPTVVDNYSVELLMTGGEYRIKSKSFVGNNTMQMISNIVANKCILGVNGISAEAGISTSVYQEAGVNELMIKSCSGQVIVIADSSKIGTFYNFKTADIDQVDVLITDSKADHSKLVSIRDKGIEVVISEKEEITV